MKIANWVYVTGAPRSGTTFVGKVLSAPLSADYIHEPFNPDCGMPGIDRRFLYLRPGGEAADHYGPCISRLFTYDFHLKTGFFPNDTAWRRRIKRIVGSRGPFHLRLAKLNPFHRAAVIKDPIGCLLSGYLSEVHGVRVVWMVRHPVAFVASVLRIGWQLDLEAIKSQPDLVADHFADEPEFLAAEYATPLEGAAALWRAINRVGLRLARDNPDWTVLTHEALSQEPVEHFRRLYDDLGLEWSGRIQRRIERQTGAGNRAEAATRKVQDFRRDSGRLFELRRDMLTPEERSRVFELTRDVAVPFYPEESFALEGAG